MNNLVKRVAVSIFFSSFSLSTLARPIIIRACHEALEPEAAISAAQSAADTLGATLMIEVMPWKACLSAVETDGIDLLFTASYTDDRKAMAVYPLKKDGKTLDNQRYFGESSYSFYTLAGYENVSWQGNPTPKSTHLTGVIVAPRGYSIVLDLKKWGFKVTEANNSEANFKQLLNRSEEIDAVAALTEEGDKLIKAEPFAGKIARVTQPIREKKYYFVFSHKFYAKNKKIVDRFWDLVAEQH